MTVLSPALADDLRHRRPVRLDLGSGGPGRDGCYGVDHLPLPGVAVVADLNRPMTMLPDACAELIVSNHAFEHVTELLPLMSEVHRIVRADGTVRITVPHFSDVYGYSDPTHVRFFGLYSMHYFAEPSAQPGARKVPSFYTDIRFTIESIRIDFYDQGRVERFVAKRFSAWVNRSIRWQDFYERRLSGLFHAFQITYVLRPVKR